MIQEKRIEIILRERFKTEYTLKNTILEVGFKKSGAAYHLLTKLLDTISQIGRLFKV